MIRIALPTVALCDGCSACCESIGLPPFEVPNPDLGPVPRKPLSPWAVETYSPDLDTFLSMPAELRAEHARLVTEIDADPSGQPCAWLDRENKRCRHYEYRPVVCREWQPGGKGCVHARRGAEVVWRGDNPPDTWWNPMRDESDSYTPRNDWPDNKDKPDWWEVGRCVATAAAILGFWIAITGMG